MILNFLNLILTPKAIVPENQMSNGTALRAV